MSDDQYPIRSGRQTAHWALGHRSSVVASPFARAPRSSLFAPRFLSLALLSSLFALLFPLPARAYVEAPYALSRVISESTNVLVLRVESVDKEKHTITYRKLADLKGKHPTELVKHNIGTAGFQPREWQGVMAWAEPGKTAVMFHNGGACETCIDNYWYQAYAGGEWWNMSHAEPYLLRSYAGKPEKLAPAVTALLAGQEVVVSAMVDGDKNALQLRAAKVQRLKASMKNQDYNPQRDFAGWGADDLRMLLGMPAFTHYGVLPRLGLGAAGVSVADFDGDGAPDFVLAAENRVALFKNAGSSMEEVALSITGGARTAAWADYNGDGKPDLLLATPTGVKLLTNLGEGKFRDDTKLLPPQPYASALAAAWIDTEGRGKPDILVADGFGGLRLYRNMGPPPAVAPAPAARPVVVAPPPPAPAPPPAAVAAPAPAAPEPDFSAVRSTKWSYIGPFDNPGGTGGFDAAYPPEKEIDLAKTYPGKGGRSVGWKEGAFLREDNNDLAALFPAPDNQNAVVYLYRQYTVPVATDFPLSLGSDDGLVVWLNGEKLLAQNVSRSCEPGQALVTLKLKPGPNALLLKVTQGDGAWAFCYTLGTLPAPPAPGNTPTPAPAPAPAPAKIEAAAPPAAPPAPPAPAPAPPRPPRTTWFDDVSAEVGLGSSGAAGALKGDHLLVADLNGDGRPDVLFSAGRGVVLLNTPRGFVEVRDCGLDFAPGHVAPALGDFDGTGRPGLFVPQRGVGKLYRSLGNGRFADITARAGALAQPIGDATCAAWVDLFNRGKLDLLVGCVRGPNRYYRNLGNGAFADATEDLGLYQRIFNTRGIGVADLNKDGTLDVIFHNEGNESAVLLGNPAVLGSRKK